MLDEFLAQIYLNVDQCKAELEQVCNEEIILKRLDNCKEHAQLYMYYKKQSQQHTRANTTEKNKENFNAGVQTSFKSNRQISFDLENLCQDKEVISRKSIQEKQKELKEALNSIQISNKQDLSSMRFDSSLETGKIDNQNTTNILSIMKQDFDQLDSMNQTSCLSSQYQMTDFDCSDDDDDCQNIASYYKENGQQIDEQEYKNLLRQNRAGASHKIYMKINQKKVPVWAQDNSLIKEQSYKEFLNKSYLDNFGTLQHQKQVHWLRIFDESVIMERFESNKWTPQNSEEEFSDIPENENLNINLIKKSDSNILNQTNISENIKKYQLTQMHYQAKDQIIF